MCYGQRQRLCLVFGETAVRSNGRDAGYLLSSASPESDGTLQRIKCVLRQAADFDRTTKSFVERFVESDGNGYNKCWNYYLYRVSFTCANIKVIYCE